MLRTDAALEVFARLASPTYAGAPGAGACGGLGFAVLALGGQLSTGPALTHLGRRSARAARGGPRRDGMLGLRREPRRGCRRGHGRGGGSGLAPCIVIAGEVLIGSPKCAPWGLRRRTQCANRCTTTRRRS